MKKILIASFFFSLFYENHYSSLACNDALKHECNKIIVHLLFLSVLLRVTAFAGVIKSVSMQGSFFGKHVLYQTLSPCVLHFSEIKLNKEK